MPRREWDFHEILLGRENNFRTKISREISEFTEIKFVIVMVI